jgi:RNA polymerase sigma-70 factor (ECF subfamily)
MSPATRPTDETLLHNLRAGKRRAFEGLYADYHAPIYNLCARILGDREEAQDVTQEVFLKAFRTLPREEVYSLRPWLYRVATNACLNQLRSRKGGGGEGALIEEMPAKVDGFEQSQTVAYVEETLAQLNDRYRTALVLKDLHGLPSAEIAAVLELPRGSADVLVHRARAAFKRVFAQVAGETPAPANLGLVLAPLAVPAALQLMPLLPHIPAPLPVHPFHPLDGSGAGLLAKLSTALGSKLAAATLAAGLLVGGGIAVDQLATHSSRDREATAKAAVAAPSAVKSSRFATYKGPSHILREHWAGHGCPSGDASCTGDHAGSRGHDIHNATEHAGSTHDTTAQHDSGETSHGTQMTATSTTHDATEHTNDAGTMSGGDSHHSGSE